MSATTRKISEIAFSRKGKKPKRLEQLSFDGAVPYLDIKAFEQGIIRQYADSASSTLAVADDILIVWDGARSGLSGIGHTGALGSTIAALTLREGYPRYVFRFLQSKYDQINSQHKGTGIPHVDPEVLWNLELRFPSIDEQRRIAGRLDHIAAHLDDTRARLDTIPAILKRFRMSVLEAGCSGRLTEDWRNAFPVTDIAGNESPDLPTDWKSETIGSVTESTFYGPRFASADYSVEGTPTIRTTDIDFKGSITLENAPRLSLSEKDIQKYRLLDGDIVVTRTGATIGKCAAYSSEIGPAIPSAYLIRVRLNQQLAKPKFVLFNLMSSTGQRHLLEGTTAVAQPNINANAILSFPLRLPPLIEQEEIVNRIEQLLAYAETIESRYRKAKTFTDKLMPSVLAKAFRGELV